VRIVLEIWRQKNANAAGQMTRYELPKVNPDMSFLEMLDVLNEELIAKGEDPVAFEHDCRGGHLRAPAAS
jgi:succinate dehydrogenase / fumarate reductase iron-sulfur subunit